MGARSTVGARLTADAIDRRRGFDRGREIDRGAGLGGGSSQVVGDVFRRAAALGGPHRRIRGPGRRRLRELAPTCRRTVPIRGVAGSLSTGDGGRTHRGRRPEAQGNGRGSTGEGSPLDTGSAKIRGAISEDIERRKEALTP